MDESLTPEKILHRLEELRKWQKIQEERLRQQQILQRKELEEEQKRFLESLSTSQRELAMQASDDDKSYLSTNSFYYDSPKAPAEDVQSRLSLHCNVMDGVSPLNISNESEPRLSPALSSALESGHSQKYDSEHSDQYHNRSRDLEKYTLNSVEYGNDNTDQPHASFHLEKSHNSGKYHDDYKSGKSDDVDTHIYHKPSAIEKAGQKNNQTNKSKTKPKLNDLPNIPQIKDSISMNPYQMSKKSTLQSIKKIAGANDNSNSKTIPVAEKFSQNSNKHNMDEGKTQVKLDDLQIIPMAKDFNSLLESKIKSNDAGISSQQSKKTTQNLGHKKSKPFLKRGQGMVRFNMKTDDIGLVKNKKLPWTKKKVGNNNSHVARKEKLRNDIHSNENNDKLRNDIPSNENNDKVDNIELYDDKLKLTEAKICYKSKKKLDYLHQTEESYSPMSPQKSPVSDSNLHDQSESLNFSEDILTLMRSKKTWASLLTEEQEYYIKILRETSKYKHLFDDSDHNNSSDYSTIASPSLEKVKHDKEIAEQRMFDMLEKKVDNSSFCSTGSFVAKVIGYRGTDTPTANREYVKSFPHVLNLKPSLSDLKTIENLDSSKESLDTVRTKEDTSRDENSNPKDDEHSEDNADTDKDEYSDSTDTEPTCKISLNQGISTSTPNQAQMQKDNINYKDFCIRTSPTQKKKVIKIVICPDSVENSKMVEDSDTQTHLEEKTLIYDETSAFEDKNNRGCDKDLSDKAELLKTRLQELQKEIDIFKKENDLIVTMKKELELEKETFLKEKAEAERKMNEDKIVSEFYLAEEKEKLAKQKALYDRHIKDMKGQSLKKDREEISVLRKELSELKEQMKTRDAKVGATQARLRNQVKNLEKDNVDLKIDSERLTKENTKLRNSNLRSQRISNIKSLAEINKSLAQFSKTNKMTDVEIEDVYPEKNISKEFLEGDVTSKSKKNKRFIKPTVIKHKPIRAKSVPNLSVTSEYAKYFSKRDEETIQSQREQLGYGLYSDNESSISSDSDLEHSRSFQSSNKQRKRSNKSLDLPKVRDFHNYSHSKKSSQNENPTHKISDDNLNKSQSRSRRLSDLKSHEYSVEQIYSEKFNNNDEGSQNNSFLAGIPKYNEPRRPDKPAQPNSNSNNDHVIIDRPDGSKEIRFTNGNVKIVSPDGSYSKFLYYNGDVKETLYNEGTIKYYYKEVNTRHTTYKDGSQVLEFPDGQIERRYPDGSVESRLADGGTRWARAGGTQEWRFPDGTLLVVTPQGDRTLRFPNGQVEVHTKDHKRREFPDGTVKVVYADGVVETRYANGRIRVKDKQDKLILDSAGSGNIPHNVS